MTDPKIERNYGENWKFNEKNGFVNINVTDKDDFFLALSQGTFENISSIFKFGRHPGVAGIEHVIWDGASNYTFLSAAETMDIVSTSANDDSAGTGARTIIIYGLDANYNEISEIVTMDGLTPVTTINSFFRVYRALVITSGTYSPIGDANIGDITITSSDTTTLQAKIIAGNGQTLMCVYTVPAGKTAYITGVGASVPSGKSCLIKAKSSNGPGTGYAFSVKYTLDMYQQSVTQMLKVPFEVAEKTDIVFTVLGELGVTTAVSASFGLILINNE